MQNVVAKLGKVLFHPITSYMTFHGKATVWEDLNFAPTSAGGPTATKPDNVTINNVFYVEFTSSNNQKCGDAKEIPHKYKLGSILHPHMHVFLKAGESAGATGVTFTLYYSLRTLTGTVTGNVTMTATSAQLSASGHKVDIEGAEIAGSSELGAQLTLALYRTGGNAGDVVVMTYGVHYEIDSAGSSQELVKNSA